MPPNMRSSSAYCHRRSGRRRDSADLESVPNATGIGAQVIRYAQLLCRRFATALAVVAALAFVADGALGAGHHLGDGRQRCTITRTFTATAIRHAPIIRSSMPMPWTAPTSLRHHHGSAPQSGAGCRGELLLLRLRRGDRAAQPERAGRAVRAGADHGQCQPSARATASCLTACAGHPRPLAIA